MRDFNHTVNVLVQAYLNDTLVQGHPCGCAIGNLIAACNGHKVINNQPIMWQDSSVGSGFDWYEVLFPGKIYRSPGDITLGVLQIKSTGYSIPEIRLIEEAFESTREGCKTSTNESIFAGLMATVNVLAAIHNIDLTVREEAKLLFAK